jgi:hypothetical protein
MHRMQPYTSIDRKMTLSAGGACRLGRPDPPLSPSTCRQSLHSSKRTGLDPPEGREAENASKRSRHDDPASPPAAESKILATQSPHLPLQAVGRASMSGSYPPLSGASDAALFMYMAEKQTPLGGYYSGAAWPYFGSSVVSTLPVRMDFMGMPPSSATVESLRRRADFLASLAYRQAHLGFHGAPGSAMPSVAASFNPMMHHHISAAHAPPTRSDRPSPVGVPRRDSKSELPAMRMPLSSEKPLIATPEDDDQHPRNDTLVCLDISIDQDPNWLSELQCFVRKNLLEVCWANGEDVAARVASKKVSMEQVGIRCRFCAHKPAGCRAQRSSAFPSSIPQIYQSFTMMLRDHFDTCTCIPEDIKTQYLSLKRSTCQGATEAKKYWSYSAAKLGLVDSGHGMIMNDSTRAATKTIPPFGANAGEVGVPLGEDGNPLMLIQSSDHGSAPAFLYTLLSHFQRVELLPSERKGNRMSLKCGLPGFGCVHCCQKGRFGLSRVFPARRRTLPFRVTDLYDHICRCNLCPRKAKKILQRLRDQEKKEPSREKQFLDLVWGRLGHNSSNP